MSFIEVVDFIAQAFALVLTAGIVAWCIFGLIAVFAVVLMQDSDPDLFRAAGVQL